MATTIGVHSFKRTTFRQPTFCAACGHFIWGVRLQGYACVADNYPICKACFKRGEEHLPGNCGSWKSSQSRTSSQSSSSSSSSSDSLSHTLPEKTGAISSAQVPFAQVLASVRDSSPEVREVNVWEATLEHERTVAIVDAVSENTHIECFNLSYCDLRTESLEYLFVKLGGAQHLRSLDVRGSPIEHRVCEKLVEFLNHHPRLAEFRFELAADVPDVIRVQIDNVLQSSEAFVCFLSEGGPRADLSHRVLTSVSIVPAWNDHLRDLDLSFNCLRSCPDELFQLSRLQKLNLEHNKLSLFSDEFQRLGCLEHLNLKHNRIKRIPDSVIALQKLKVLNLSRNRISVVNEEALSEMPVLCELHLYHNPLKDKPPLKDKSHHVTIMDRIRKAHNSSYSVSVTSTTGKSSTPSLMCSSSSASTSSASTSSASTSSTSTSSRLSPRAASLSTTSAPSIEASSLGESASRSLHLRRPLRRRKSWTPSLTFSSVLSKVRENDPRLHTLRLRGKQLTDQDLQALALALQDNRYLVSLDLRDNATVSDEGGCALASVVDVALNSTLECLDFRGTCIGVETLRAFHQQLLADDVNLYEILIDESLQECAADVWLSLLARLSRNQNRMRALKMTSILTSYGQLMVTVKRFRKVDRTDFDPYVVARFQKQTERTKVGALHIPLFFDLSKDHSSSSVTSAITPLFIELMDHFRVLHDEMVGYVQLSFDELVDQNKQERWLSLRSDEIPCEAQLLIVTKFV